VTLRGGLARRVRRVRGELWSILQTAVAAGVAWALAALIHPHPFFAPVSAVIALYGARGQRTRRAIEITVGVAVGIAVADLIVRALGANTLVLTLVVALAMAGALLLGAGTLLVNQAAISAILVVATLQPGASPSPGRFLDALIGGCVALLVGQVLFPHDPLRALAKAARPVVDDLAAALAATAAAMRSGDEDGARAALESARATDGDLAAFFDTVAHARETFSLRAQARTRERVPAYAAAVQQLDYAVRNTRVLVRRVLNAIRRGGAAAPELADAVELLGRAVRELGSQLEDPDREVATRTLALEAAVKATAVAAAGADLSVMVIVGQVRSTAVDLLRGSGMDGDEARGALDAAVQRAVGGGQPGTASR
jgi:uncharacterized membrane protein YgaE (UPF0421/DUF939 family)